jgi:hypothetical protein
MNSVLPAATSWAEICTVEKTNKESKSSVSRWPVGLQEIIDSIDLKNVDKSVNQAQK